MPDGVGFTCDDISSDQGCSGDWVVLQYQERGSCVCNSGDDGDARMATLNGPKHLCIDNDGNVIIADTENHLIRKLRVAEGSYQDVIRYREHILPIAEALEETKGHSREAGAQARERVRQAAEELRSEVRSAVREARRNWGEAPEDRTEAASEPHSATETEASADAPRQDREIINILNAVKAGRLSPEEADDLIKAWTEVRDAQPKA